MENYRPPFQKQVSNEDSALLVSAAGIMADVDVAEASYAVFIQDAEDGGKRILIELHPWRKNG